MKTRLLKLWEGLRASYWFIPGLMTLGAIGLAVVAEIVDRNTPPEVVQTLALVYQGGPDGARAVLSTVAGSMITVAGVAFSITMVALVLASSQFGPRILRNFMRDRGNQFVLGTFIATFLYCLLVLRLVQGGDRQSFVPHLAITFAVLLALGSVAVLIYFIDHVADSIQAPNVVARVGADVDRAVDRYFREPEHDPEQSPGEGAGRSGSAEGERGGAGRSGARWGGRPVLADRSGYIQLIDEGRLVSAAADADVVISCLQRQGGFALEGAPIARVSPADNLDDETASRIRAAFLYGKTRTDIQDLDFALKQLVEIAVRALSPGINDPFTATNCIDLLAASLARAGRRIPIDSRLRDEDGTTRVHLRHPLFADLLDIAFDPIREHGRSSTDVLARILEGLLALESVVDRAEGRIAILGHGDRVAETAAEGLTDSAGRRRVEALHRLLRSRLDDVLEKSDRSEPESGEAEQ